MPIKLIGCCGAYCKSCKAFNTGYCKGCKVGYASGTRDLSKARCKIKVCCISHKLDSCANCDDFASCKILEEFYSRNGFKYGKYKQALGFIRANGHEAFFAFADKWRNAYGRYPKQQ
jgi:hypothetical protein